MTVIARVRTWNVVKVFAFSNAAVMTADTRSDYGRVIDQRDRIPGDDRMARLTLVVGGDVINIGAGGRSAVVAREAPGCNRVVIESSRRPDFRHVAGLTIVATGNMIWRLARRLHTVVTRTAGSKRKQVIHPVHRIPGALIVACATLPTYCDVLR